MWSYEFALEFISLSTWKWKVLLHHLSILFGEWTYQSSKELEIIFAQDPLELWFQFNNDQMKSMMSTKLSFIQNSNWLYLHLTFDAMRWKTKISFAGVIPDNCTSAPDNPNFPFWPAIEMCTRIITTYNLCG